MGIEIDPRSFPVWNLDQARGRESVHRIFAVWIVDHCGDYYSAIVPYKSRENGKLCYSKCHKII